MGIPNTSVSRHSSLPAVPAFVWMLDWPRDKEMVVPLTHPQEKVPEGDGKLSDEGQREDNGVAEELQDYASGDLGPGLNYLLIVSVTWTKPFPSPGLSLPIYTTKGFLFETVKPFPFDTL